MTFDASEIQPGRTYAIRATIGIDGQMLFTTTTRHTVFYADRLVELADSIGDDHVEFGTDMNALSNSPITRFADLRRALEHMAARGVERERLKKIAIGNYARVLQTAMTAGKA